MMRLLTEDFFARSPVLAYPVLAMVLFLAVFLVVSVRALLSRRESLDELARMPLVDGDTQGGTGSVEGGRP